MTALPTLSASCTRVAIEEAVPRPAVAAGEERPALGRPIVAAEGAPNLFGVDLSDVELRADDLTGPSGSGASVQGPAQALALVAAGRPRPPGRLHGEAAALFTQS